MRLHEIRAGRAKGTADGARESPVAPQAADEEGVADVRLDQLQVRLRPFARVKRDRDVALEQRLERGLEEALGAAIGRVALADEGEAQSLAEKLGLE